MRTYVLLGIFLTLLAMAADPAAAQPACGMSFINAPLPLGRSPKNTEVGAGFQYTYSVTLRNAAGAPVVGWPIAGATITIGPPCANPAVLSPSGPSDAAGVMTWNAATLDFGGGGCAGPGPAFVSIIPIGCVFPIPYVTSPDIDGNGVIALSDLSTFLTTFLNGGPAWSGDFNRDGIPGLADLVFFQRHFVAP